MHLPDLKTMLLLAGLVTPIAFPAHSQEDQATLASDLSPRLLFVTSGGYWEETTENDAAADSEPAAPDADAEAPPELAEAAPSGRGYYRLIAIRGEDNRSLVYLQQIALTAQGPELALSIGVDEINTLGGYVTDIRPEDSTGAASAVGFGAYIYLKTDPTVAEPETWALYIDEFGDMQVERSSN